MSTDWRDKFITKRESRGVTDRNIYTVWDKKHKYIVDRCKSKEEARTACDTYAKSLKDKGEALLCYVECKVYRGGYRVYTVKDGNGNELKGTPDRWKAYSAVNDYLKTIEA